MLSDASELSVGQGRCHDDDHSSSKISYRSGRDLRALISGRWGTSVDGRQALAKPAKHRARRSAGKITVVLAIQLDSR